jgi:NodT family efflux transporter outer membrane factor (OMF) lipoprotein
MIARTSLIAAISATLALSACTVGPNYHQPTLATPPSFARTLPTAPPVTGDLSSWWETFNDPMLTYLVRQALAANPDVETAASRVREARTQIITARATELPSVNASGNAIDFNSNHKSSGASASSSAGAASGLGLPIPSTLHLYSAGFDATWEVDLFGGGRRRGEQAKASEQAAVWALRDVQVSLAAEVASDYLTLRLTQARIAVGVAELQRQKVIAGVVAARRKTGFVTNLDVNQQNVQVETAAAQIPQLQSQAETEVHAVAVLLGQTPENLGQLLQVSANPLPPEPPALPAGLPSQLLERRPDVREAERQLAAANANIGVQTANLFPKVNLIGLASFASTSVSNIFSSDDLATIGLGMVTQPVFDAGKTHAAIKTAKEERRQALFAYQKAGLGALQNVEDALSKYAADAARRESLQRALASTSNSVTLAQDQYKVGLVAFINVIQSENAQLNARDQYVQADGQVLSDLVALYKALGGGWAR